METKHTPGPWIGAGPSDGNPLPKYINEIVADREDDDECKTICYMPVVDEDDETEANARLIAAAPELLEALRPFSALLEIFEQKSANRPKSGPIYATADHRVGGRELTVEHLKAAGAAIAKAEGK